MLQFLKSLFRRRENRYLRYRCNDCRRAQRTNGIHPGRTHRLTAVYCECECNV